MLKTGPRGRGAQPRSGRRAPLERVEHLLSSSASPAAPIERIVLRALRLVVLDSLTQREERLLSLAEEIGLDEGMRSVFVSHARVYLALACCSWALDAERDASSRNAAFAAAIVLGASASENLREVMGLNDKLRLVADTDVDRGLSVNAILVASGDSHGDLAAYRAIEPVLTRLEASRTRSEVARETG